MKTQEFFNLLEEHQDKTLQFEYTTNQFVAANYHITEVKHIAIESVDCGSQSDQWNETIVQLWESPAEILKTKHMSVLKALGILNKVGTMKAYDLESEIKFEYSNRTFHTAQLFVNDFVIDNGNLFIKLASEKTDCKAKELCGVPEKVIHTLEKTKEKVEACCSSTSNCC
ncbi:DUF6428 family protein [Psychroserpens jangbogonensis]|uniref:DUF6428 family protein n=1 Tax=Psychroserpens jangbogonensis TaxID=1484460 RepID=UPI00053DBFD6|nr:DUF6428 family protein [Psychroserpens jangbogonensis]